MRHNTNWIDEYKEKYGDRWILRELDFFPERLSDLAYTETDLYTPSVYYKCCRCAYKLNWKVFTSEKEAILASQKIRRILGLPESETLENRLKTANEREIREDIEKFAKDFKEKYNRNIVINVQ